MGVLPEDASPDDSVVVQTPWGTYTDEDEQTATILISWDLSDMCNQADLYWNTQWVNKNVQHYIYVCVRYIYIYI